MTSSEEQAGIGLTGTVFSIERYAVHDGGGIRTMVYLKGCPLRCLWCANPEGQASDPELFSFSERCIACRRCDAVCPTGTARRDGAGVTPCVVCGRCADACPAEARRLFGRQMTVEHVLQEILKDRAFYRRSGGGVTLSGGEPAVQAAFGCAVLSACRAHGLDTAVETCGYASFPQLASLAEHCELFLYDLKHMNSEAHRRLTGVPNDLIIENLRRLAAVSTIVVRVPVIPGHNDGAENLTALARFVASLSPVPEIELLPYHNYGSAKYARAGRAYALGSLPLPSPEHMQGLAARLEGLGVSCHVG